MKTEKQMCESCHKRVATWKRVLFGDIHCEVCINQLEGSFEAI